MPGPQTAIRETDEISHSDALFGAIEGVLIGLAVGVVVGALVVSTGGLAGAVLIGGWALIGGGIGGMFGKTIGRHSTQGAGQVATGSPNVWIGHDIKRAARAHADVAHCSNHSDSEQSEFLSGTLGKRIAQGSATVFINGYHAAREGDKGTCDFTLGQGWSTVVIGGPTATVDSIDPEVPVFVDDIITGMAIVGTMILMWPGAVAMFSAGTAAGLTGGLLGVTANVAQVGLRLVAQVYVGMQLGEAGGQVGHGMAGLFGAEDGSLTSDLMTQGGATLAPFAGGGLYKGIAEAPLPGMEAPTSAAGGVVDPVAPADAMQRGPTGARTSFDGSAAEQARADAAYDQIRADNGDVARIARNTGYSPEQIASVKQHLFYNEHDIPIGNDQTGDLQTSRQRFTADPAIADRWTKAADGTLGQPNTYPWGDPIPGSADPAEVSDFHSLIAHEYTEQGLMSDGLPYRSPESWGQGARGWDFYPDAQNAGAHDLSPLASPDGRDPFTHYDALGRSSDGIPRPNEDLSNLDEMLDAIRRSQGPNGPAGPEGGSGGPEGGPNTGGPSGPSPPEPFVRSQPLPATLVEGIPITPAPAAEPLAAPEAGPGAAPDTGTAPEAHAPVAETEPEASRETPVPAPDAAALQPDAVVQPNDLPFAQRTSSEPLPEDPALRQQMLSRETEQTRANSRVARAIVKGKKLGGCVGVARTDIPGLEDRVFEGGSPYSGDIPDNTFIHGDGSNGQAQSHAEQNLAGEFDRAVKSEMDAGNLQAADLQGTNVYMHTELDTCASCKWGINTPGVPDAKLGVPMKLSQAYPDVTFTYTSDDPMGRVLTIKNGIATKTTLP